MSKQEHDTAAAELRASIASCDKPWYKSCADLLDRKGIRGKKCLDLCCGNGEFSHLLREKHQMDVTCADYINLHLHHVKDEGFITISIDLDASAEQINMVAVDYEGQFDLVVNLAAIEHVFNSDNLLRFSHTVLKPNGHLIVNTPNIDFLAYRIYGLFSGNRPFGEGHHIRFWDYRFLRTNLFLNGFTVVEDSRKFYALPQDTMQRAFRNRKHVAILAAWMFQSCHLLQYLPGLRGLCTDELTVLAVKDDVPAIGFELNTVRHFFKKHQGTEIEKAGIERLQQAKMNGWLKEHLYLSMLVDELHS